MKQAHINEIVPALVGEPHVLNRKSLLDTTLPKKGKKRRRKKMLNESVAYPFILRIFGATLLAKSFVLEPRSNVMAELFEHVGTNSIHHHMYREN